MSFFDETLPTENINSLEQYKFFLDSEGNVRVRTSADVTGTITPSGLQNGGLNTTVLITDTATKLPVTALSDRNSILLKNESQTTYVRLGFDNTVIAELAVGNLTGKKLDPEDEFNVDIKDTVELWAIAPSGESALIQIMELS